MKYDRDVMLWVAIAVCFIIGVIVAWTIKSNDTDKVKGDKRLVAAVFIMSSFIFAGVKWGYNNCRR